MTFTLLAPFEEDYYDRESYKFRELSSGITEAIDELYTELPGTQSASIVSIEPREADSFTAKVTVDLGTVDYYNEERIKEHLLNHIYRMQRFGSHPVSSDNFKFVRFEGT